MNQKLQNILDIIQQSKKLDAEQKNNLTEAVKDAAKELEITSFKLERTEKVKKTTAILLEETIEELEQKRKAIEAQNRELEIEASLERVRAVAMGMTKSDDLLSICEISFKEFKKLGFDNLRNTIIHILNDKKGFFLDYDFSDYLGGSIYNIGYKSHPIVEDYLKKIKRADDAFAKVVIEGSQLEGWKDFRRKGGQRDDPKLDDIPALYYYLYSIGVGDIGISTLKPIDESQINILKRFRNVFDLAYKRYNDIALAELQAREAQIELALERVRARTMAMQKSEELKEVIQLVYEQFVHLKINVDHAGFVVDYTPKGDWHFWIADEQDIPSKITHPYFESVWANQFNEAKEKGADFFATNLNFEEKNKFYNELLSYVPGLPEASKDFYLSCPGLAGSTVLFDNVSLYIENFSGIPYSDEENKILMRFGKVFQQTYTRFLDLQKAEAQAREAKVEAALERVRSLALGMRKSEDVGNVTDQFFTELTELSVDVKGCSIVVIDEDNDKMELWRARSNIAVKPFDSTSFAESMDLLKKYIPDWFSTFTKALGKRKNYLIDELLGKRRSQFINLIAEQYKYSSVEKSQLLKNAPEKITAHYIFFKLGYLGLLGEKKLSDENLSVAQRFVEVFDFAYTRFLDIKKAEAQAREAEIELALERVRAKTMAMQSSNELKEVVANMFDGMKSLGVDPTVCNIALIDKKTRDTEVWTAHHTDSGLLTYKLFIPHFEHPFRENLLNSFLNEIPFSTHQLSGDSKKSYAEYLLEHVDYSNVPDEIIKSNENLAITEDGIVLSAAYMKYGLLIISRSSAISNDESDILQRFAKVFEQTYTRFLDLQKAEAQARESQIEGALERVRSKTMAMHNSNDVGDTVVTLFDEVLKLGLDKSIRCGIGILEGNEGMETWSATSHPNGKVDLKMGMLDMTIHPMLIGLKKAWESGETSYSYDYIGDDVFRYYEALNNEPEYPFQADLESLPENEYHKSFFYSEGILFSFAPNPISEEAAKVLNRFASVFGQTYRRYLDLRNAEAQAREAKIEASLERVRSKAMAMHSPNDLSETVNVFFKELKNLGIAPIRCGVGQIDEATRTTSLTTTTSSQQGESFEVIGKIKQTGHPVLDGIFENWKLQKEYHPVLQGEDIKAYYRLMKPQITFPDYPEYATQYGNLFYFKEGFVFAWTESKLSEEELQIFRRFTSVLSLTYRRYIDLKEAEGRSVEAIRQASLDRVRAEIASMRTTNDLEKITPLIWRELTTLGVPFFRCGVFIIDEPNSVAHAYLSTPLGKSLAALHVKIDNTWLENAVKHWRNGEIYHEVWDRNKFLAWTQTMMEQGFVENKEHFQEGKEAPEILSLQLLPFTQGMLYVGSKLPLSNEEIKIAQKLADDFGVAYSRYEDFQKLEAVNHRKTLELEEARQLQLSMLPKVLPKLPTLDIAVYMKTATEVGGDYYDFNVDTNGTLTVAIGDATGHGMKAGTIVSMIKALFASGGSRMDLKSYFKQSSDALKGIELGRLMMAFLMLRINSHKLQFANAGMPPLFIYRKASNSVEEIMINGMPLGAIKDFPYQIREMEISSGDTILLLSDGLPELKNGKDEHYGYNRVKDEFKSVAEKSPDDIVSYLKNSAADWVNGVEPDDDVTFVIIKIR